jgi:CBS domain-containing protein
MRGVSGPSRHAPLTGGNAPISVYTTDEVATIPPDASVLDAVNELVADEVGLLVVGTADRVEGVLSERDVVRAIAAGRDPAATSVSEVVRTRLVWSDPTATVAEVATLMMTEYVRHVLVGADDRLVGIVSARDLLGAYASGEFADPDDEG